MYVIVPLSCVVSDPSGFSKVDSAWLLLAFVRGEFVDDVPWVRCRGEVAKFFPTFELFPLNCFLVLWLFVVV